MMVIGIVIFITLVFGKELLLEKSAEHGILNNDFEFRCITNTSKTNVIRWNLNKDSKALVTGAGCTVSPGSDPRFSYACEDDTYSLTIPGENMTQDLNNSQWQCRDPYGEFSSTRLLLVIVKQDKNQTEDTTTGISVSETSYSHTELTTVTTDPNLEKRNSGNKTTKDHFVSGKDLILVVSATGSVLLLVTAIVIFKLTSKYRNTDRSEYNERKLDSSDHHGMNVTEHENQGRIIELQAVELHIDLEEHDNDLEEHDPTYDRSHYSTIEYESHYSMIDERGDLLPRPRVNRQITEIVREIATADVHEELIINDYLEPSCKRFSEETLCDFRNFIEKENIEERKETAYDYSEISDDIFCDDDAFGAESKQKRDKVLEKTVSLANEEYDDVAIASTSEKLHTYSNATTGEHYYNL